MEHFSSYEKQLKKEKSFQTLMKKKELQNRRERKKSYTWEKKNKSENSWFFFKIDWFERFGKCKYKQCGKTKADRFNTKELGRKIKNLLEENPFDFTEYLEKQQEESEIDIGLFLELDGEEKYCIQSNTNKDAYTRYGVSEK